MVAKMGPINNFSQILYTKKKIKEKVPGFMKYGWRME